MSSELSFYYNYDNFIKSTAGVVNEVGIGQLNESKKNKDSADEFTGNVCARACVCVGVYPLDWSVVLPNPRIQVTDLSM